MAPGTPHSGEPARDLVVEPRFAEGGLIIVDVDSVPVAGEVVSATEPVQVENGDSSNGHGRITTAARMMLDVW